MSVLFLNNAVTTLAAGVGNYATSIAVVDGSVFPAITGSDYFYLTLEVASNPNLKEIVKCTARSGNTLTIARGQDGTSARTFSTADKAELRLTAAGLNDVATQADTNTTYSIQDGELSENNFTNADHTKLNALDATAYATAAQGTKADAALAKAGGVLSGDVDGNGNKVLFGNVYSTLGDLPSASTYHGMFAHVHATGKGYFAHAGAWVPLANDTEKLSLSGGAMTGAITTNSTFDGVDIATRDGVLSSTTTTANAALPKAGGSMSGAIAMGTSKITGAGDPTAAQDVATKAYVDANAGGGGGATSITRITKTANYTIVAGDAGKVLEHTANNITLTFTAAATLGDGFHIWIKNIAAGGVTSFGFSGSEYLSSQYAADKLYNGGSFHIYCDGSNFKILDDARGVSTNNTSGISPQASGARSVALGVESVSSGIETSALGYYTKATGTKSAAFGYAAHATGTNAFAGMWANASGSDSTAINIRSESTSYGATGTRSFATGYLCKASGYSAKCISNISVASGDLSTVIGGSNSLADSEYGIAKGLFGNTNGVRGKEAFGNGGGRQRAQYCLSGDTTDATATVIGTNFQFPTPSTSNQLFIPNNTVIAFSGLVTCRQQAADGTDSAAFEIKGLLRREGAANTTTLVNSVVNTISNAQSFGVALTANTTLGSLSITVTGAASHDLRWVAQLDSAEATYA